MGNDEEMKFQVYGIEINKKIKWMLSANVKVDLAFWYEKNVEQIIIVSPSASVGHAVAYIQCLEKKRTMDACQKQVAIPPTYTVRKTIADFSSYYLLYEEWKKSFFRPFQGKLLLLDEILNYMEQQHDRRILSKEMVSSIIQTGYLLQEIQITSGVTYPQDSLVCHRCGSTDRVVIQDCSICGESCATCEACIEMGRSKTCTPLLHVIPNQQSTQGISNSPLIRTSYHLTPFQQDIAQAAKRFITDKNKQKLLIWAVTGAGKTEMIFPTIFHSLELGYRILLASPRKDVIKELTPRFKKAFINVPIVSLYGGSEEKWETGAIYLATTHQVMRFYHFFDLVIIDEMDAYPYHNNRLLQHAVNRALKDDGKMIYMTATPSKEWMHRVKRREIDSAVLPIRYHGNPIPVPRIKIMPKKAKLLNQATPFFFIDQFASKVRNKESQAFIFVSSIKEIFPWVKQWGKWFSGDSVEGIYANDPNRDRKIERFRNKEIQFLMTTTIMERGVTIENVHVLVLGADARIFDEATLVQITGRVGRTVEFPHGSVCFLAERLTKDMVKAKKHIVRMNRLAEKYKKEKKQ